MIRVHIIQLKISKTVISSLPLSYYPSHIVLPLIKSYVFKPEPVYKEDEEAWRAGDGVVPDSAQEPGRALGQDGHLRGCRRRQEADWSVQVYPMVANLISGYYTRNQLQ